MIAHTFTKDGLRWQMHLVAEVIVGFTLQPNLDQSGCDFLLILFIKFSPSNIKHFCNEVEHYIYISTDYRLVYIFITPDTDQSEHCYINCSPWATLEIGFSQVEHTQHYL